MTETLRESASALMDNESTELELRRLQRDGASEGTDNWLSRQYATRDLIQNRAHQTCPDAVKSAIFAALEAEPAHRERRAAGAPAWVRPFTGLAVAASVCAAVLVGVGGANMVDTSLTGETGLVSATVQPAAPISGLGQARVIAAGQTGVVNVAYGPSTSPVATAAFEDANALAARRLYRYLQQHSEGAALNGSQGMMPMARVVNVEAR